MPLNASNSYATVSEADAFAVDHPYGDGWVALDADRKAKLLILASQLLDEHFDWAGSPASGSQALGFPRTGLRTRNGAGLSSSDIPTPIKLATWELARRLDAKDLTDDQVVADLRISKAGDTSFGEGVRRKVVPDAVADIIPSSWYVQSSTQAAAGGVLALPLERA